ncbi:efflux RND transporter periplasmic adaptor subunit [Sulfurovum sp.]|uniref:efflux RND transporter periplasmic adaptor subunit n=1 Tax=Sulfurovum sp. TaxID=1969726 RepID=UPI0025FB1591|nr:efflux RND transporter periplasmic adaptor subunit [Sulfurovum sp.]
MIKTLGKRILVLLVIAAIVVGGMMLVKAKRAKEAQTPLPEVYPMVVKTMQLKPSKVQLTLPYIAEVQNDENVLLASRMSARVLSIKKSGEAVKKGDVVAILDTEELKANIGSAKIALANLLKTHKRTQALYKVKGASVEQLQKEESNIAALKAKLKALKNQMSYATLIAPVSGVIAKAFETEGSIAMPGKPLLKISATKGFSFIARLPDGIKPESILFQGEMYPLQALGSTFQGLNEYKAYVNAGHLTAGETAEIRVVVFDGKGTKLPFDAILDRNGKSYVFVIQNDRAVPKEVHILQKGEEGVVIKEDLKQEKVVVAKPDILLKLLTGIAVKVEG